MIPVMRRGRQALPQAVCEEILTRSTAGVLALADADGFPYTVPLSYLYQEGKIWFHCARAGYKLDLMRQNPRASFCVIGQDQVVPEEYTTYYRSVVARGTLREVTAPAAKEDIARRLGRKYAPAQPEEALEAELRQYRDAVCILELTVEQLTGKEGSQLARQRRGEAQL